ncbi:AraC family transcriptional regulator [Macellibacteroides fermentans]|uniref:LacI family transcriptional regulator n=1 Tax=Macellibacteroides fermentans TaxID=879969 RepID=A0A8E2A3C2_9PORP|nr:DNA-binding transcriptional regulator [Macellibacteroides fermentans]NYI50073.1 LacI family transcriptional regulator [Macellibacteroides fermentans]
MAKILLLTDFSSGYSRNLLKGIVRYSKEVGNWSFQRMPLYYRMLYGENGVVEWAKKWQADAIIAQLSDVNIELLNDLNIPIIVQNYRDRNKAVSNLTGDYFNTGVMAAKFFLNRGYRNFAFYGFKGAIWSRERADGYSHEIEKQGYKLAVLENDNKDKEEWSYNHTVLGNWLQSLPKPVALFACDDHFALQISETCNVYNINVPDDIAILGVDNDDLLCNISDPPLSSIVLDVENGGYNAGKLLHQLITKEITEPFNIVVNPLIIERRKSTEKYAVSDKNIRTILNYIEKNYANHLSVEELVKQVPLSRRVLEKKFKEETGESLYQYIQNYRIDQFTRLLITTDYSLFEAALQSGFENYKNVSRIFRKYKSLSPAEYRKRYKCNSSVEEIEH